MPVIRRYEKTGFESYRTLMRCQLCGEEYIDTDRNILAAFKVLDDGSTVKEDTCPKCIKALNIKIRIKNKGKTEKWKKERKELLKTGE